MEGVLPYEFRGDLRNLPQLAPSTAARQRPAPPVRRPPASNKTFGAPSAPVGQQAQPSANILLPLTPAPSPTQNFPGMSSNDSCGSSVTCGQGAVPPDPNGDVGPSVYIEAVNSAYAIYDKATGMRLAAITEDQLWSGSATNTPCGNGNSAGDPVVVYDPQGDRWILAHMAFAFNTANPPVPISPFYECIAVSQKSDPVTGGWYLYPLRMDPGGTGLPPVGTGNDYPKFGIWTDCLYMSANEFDFTQASQPFTGTIYVSMSRAGLESGTMPLTWSLGYLNNGTDPFTMIPSNLRGTPPPTGTPNYFVSESPTSAFEVRKFTPGPSCGGNGTLSTPTNVSQTPYASVPASANGIVPQPNTSQLLDAIDDRLMQKVQYRRVGNTESLWVVHNVGVSSGLVQPQWAQIDVTGGTIATTPVQQEIYAPDTTLNRWMGSIAADKQGNVALGYSTSNGTAPNFPSIAYSGRLATDPLNTLPQTETQLVAGGVSQTGADRWGDYTGMSVDPSDDCTFWYVNEYYGSQQTGAGDWQTRIGSFKFPSCTASTVTLSPASITFSNQLVGTTSTTTNVQLTNSGSSPLSITSIALTGTDSSQFVLGAPSSGSPACSLTASSIAAGSSCFLGVQFKPTSAGSKTANVSVSDDASGSPQSVTLTGVGTLPAPVVALSPATVSFSSQPTGTASATTNVQLTNSGTASLNITSITLTGTDSSQFTLKAPTSGSPACTFTASSITVGSSCFLGIQFVPTSAGTKSANVSISDDAAGSPQTIALSGTGTAPTVTLSPPSVAFNSQAVGTRSATSNVQVTNSGTATLSITAIALAGTDSSQFALVAPTSGSPACSLGASSLNTGSSCFVGIQFVPTSTGAKSASVSVTDNASGSPQSVGLSGTGIAPKATLSPTSLPFSGQSVGTSSATMNVQLTNSGTDTLSITSITLTGTDSSQFALLAPTTGSPTCSQGTSTINAGSSCFLGVQFLPTTAGSKSAAISVTDNASGSPQMVILSGTGLGPGLALSQTSMAFGDVNVGLTSATTNLQLTNSGTATLNLTSITLTGTGSAQFALVAPTSGSPACTLGAASSISAGSSCFVGVQFRPTAIGQDNAGISVVDNAPNTPQTASLSGVGVDFSVAAAPPTTATVAAGSNASFTVDLTTTGGPTENVITFSASGNPSATSVTFGPPSVPAGTTPSSTPVTMTVTTMRRSSGWPTALRFPAAPQLQLLSYSMLCLMLGTAFLSLKLNWLKGKKLIGVYFLGTVLLACAAFQGCARTGNAGGSGTPGGTPAGTSTITVTATAGSLSRTTTVSLTVQ